MDAYTLIELSGWADDLLLAIIGVFVEHQWSYKIKKWFLSISWSNISCGV